MKKVFLFMSALGIVLPYYFLINYLQEEGASLLGSKTISSVLQAASRTKSEMAASPSFPLSEGVV